MKTLYILLPVHNRKAVTERFIVCLLKQTYRAFHLILIDDGSNDGTSEMVIRLVNTSQLTILKGNGQLWWAGSLQLGINWLNDHDNTDDLVLIINDDVTFDVDFLEKGITSISQQTKTLLLAKLFDENTGHVIESGVNADLVNLIFKPANTTDEINCLSTRGLFLRLGDINRIGGFYPHWLPHYWSDYEFTIRAFRKGFHLHTTDAVYLTADQSHTGLHYIDKHQNPIQFISELFSKRSIPNPFYRTIFILLACPIAAQPILILKSWLTGLIMTIKSIINWNKRSIKILNLKLALYCTSSDTKIIIGAGGTRLNHWIPTDYPIVDVTNAKSLALFFKPESIRALLAEHVWEHLSKENGMIAAQNCYKLLKPGGYFRVAVPDGYHPDPEYIDAVKPGGTGCGSDDHKILFNYKTLSDQLVTAGFELRLLEWFDENGEFHFENWSEDDGLIQRSTRFDERNKTNPTAYTSLIIDAIKPVSE